MANLKCVVFKVAKAFEGVLIVILKVIYEGLHHSLTRLLFICFSTKELTY